MTYRTPTDVKEEFGAYPRRALIITALAYESNAVRAHLSNREIVSDMGGGYYEYGRFPDPAGDWLIVHVITAQGNASAISVTDKTYSVFGGFHVVMFVGVAGSLKEDIPIGSVVIGKSVYNGHSGKVTDTKILGSHDSYPAAPWLLSAAQMLVTSGDWTDLIRSPLKVVLPPYDKYPCDFPPQAIIKGIVSVEGVVAGGESESYLRLRTDFNNCGAVEMEGFGTMHAAYMQSTPAVIVRGISDMCAGKNHEKDKSDQPIAAAHAAAFAFSILSFLSKDPAYNRPAQQREERSSAAAQTAETPSLEERRVMIVFNFEGPLAEWTEEKSEKVVELLRQVTGDKELTLIRVEEGSVRLVMDLRESDVAALDLGKLREAVSDTGFTLLGVARMEFVGEAEKAKAALAGASVDLLGWEKTLPSGRWIERPERESIEARFQLDTSSTVLLGEPGSGKSALLSKIASDLLEHGGTVFALKSDLLSAKVNSQADLQRELQLPDLPSDLILRLATMQPVYVFIDQLDALASQLDLQSGRLNVLLNLVRSIGSQPNVHVLLSARTFEFNHDVRLRAIDAEAVTLVLPPWHEVKERLADVGIDGDTWPERARDVVRIPQALKTFIDLAGSGRAEFFTTYQAMLQQLWCDRIASANDSESLIALASDLAGQMAEQETLWLAASRFDDRLSSLKRLESLGFIVWSEDKLRVAFSHQTIFDYILARTFIRNSGLLSTYVLERQESLFIRAKVWSALNYLREAEVKSYEREFFAIWKTKELRLHLRFLLIEFLGQVEQPLEFEKTCMAEVLNSSDLRVIGLKAIGSSAGWFTHFASTAIRDAMTGDDPEAGQALQILESNWKTDDELVIRLIKERWLPHPERDNYTWMALQACHLWNDEVERIAKAVLKRSPISIWQVCRTAMTLAVNQPNAALSLVRVKLDTLLAEVRSRPEPPQCPADASEDEKTLWHISHDQRERFKGLLDSMEWDDLPSLAEAAPTTFLQCLWSWYVAVFSEILVHKGSGGAEYIYPGQYVLEIELKSSDSRSESLENPMVSALQIAVEELAKNSPEEFETWADENSKLEMLAVQQLIAHGYEVAADRLASSALEWLLLDQRRFQLGTISGRISTTIDLVYAAAQHWSKEEVGRFEKAIRSYCLQVSEHLKKPEDRRFFRDLVRATKKDLLQAVGVERLAPENRELVVTTERALGDRFNRALREFKVGWIGSPMEAAAMAKAKDCDILNIFREVPDSTNWDHPKHSMQGGNVQLSRAFAEFARKNPERAIRIIEQFEPLQQERGAGYALNAMAEDPPNGSRIIGAFLDLHARGFQTEEFRDSAASAIKKISKRKVDISDDVIEILVAWLCPSPEQSQEESEADVDVPSRTENEQLREGSILWSTGLSVALPGGNFTILSALASVLLNRGDEGRDRYLAILDDHFARERNPDIWRALLLELTHAGGSTPDIVSTFLRKLFARFPEILATPEAVIFLAYAKDWDDQFVLDLISDWHKSNQVFLQRAYGELVGLTAIATAKSEWVQARDEIMSSGTSETKIGLAHSAVNMWRQEELRKTSSEILVALLKGANKELVAAVMDVFRATDELTYDASTVELLRAMADISTDISAAPADFVVQRLQAMLPHEAELIATIAEKLITAWRSELGNVQTGAATAAPELTDLALTLHRLGGTLRQSGVALFEALIEIDAYGARETLAEIDGRFGPLRVAPRPRLARRRKARGRRR